MLDDRWVQKIFFRLGGVYGTQFRSKYSVMSDGVDVGLQAAMDAWGAELSGFGSMPEAISWALANLPTDHAPNAVEFRELCRRAPRKDVPLPALAYTPDPEDVERARSAATAAASAMRPKVTDGIDRHWATHPRSHDHLKAIFEAAARDRRFQPCIAEMVEGGICTESGKLLKAYRNSTFVPA